MGTRRRGRELALQCLYQIQYFPADLATRSEVIARFFSDPEHTGTEPEIREHAEALVRGVCADEVALEAGLSRHLKDWSWDRLAKIDRAILKMAYFEIKSGEVPREVAINEALELSRRYSSPESAGFINGVLDATARAGGSQ